ncbi:hypothetical protein J32TS6_16100 [Virgibacillus pantothenticus]|uniref:Uncharacterized protein n=1 Tax=Virgibacillus pantothenticus TaxID=1473 RepID=A0A0L0QUI1_VIRPA|nr:hypothetical protein [Virgibacillus pantothenticus]KNE22221.1 hypothetical protein AFK71_00780 [Virgibacillus pantothenticus]MED3735373.1 hypothetical protein [Virgibacillus pantothenticus]QTY16667.1 hypothetical protein KBP50_01550 [Virgibacillus pantothenticus]SIT12313.1 hypothetical protein SAMN05421787_11864 [Virgibacillus pantothenticus]GIP63055.1 hypothetical protein J32TS6_16100 [Virgibacillus pantothenticus]
MDLYFLEPEVAGGHGEKTVYGTKKDIEMEGISGKVKFLHYEIEGWLGDDLLEATPAFIISGRVENELRKSKFKDYKVEECLVTTSNEFKELYQNKKIPSFCRFIPLGTIEVIEDNFTKWSGHHFCLSSKGELVVTKEALDFLQKFSMENCDIEILKQL